MHRSVSTIRLLFFLGLGLGFSIPQAQAYVLEGPHLLDLMTHNLGHSSQLRVTQKRTIYQESEAPPQAAPLLDESDVKESEIYEVMETLFYQFPDHFRSESWFADRNRIFLAAKGEEILIIDGQVMTPNRSLSEPPIIPNHSKDFQTDASVKPDLYTDILLYRDRPLLQNCLEKVGVDTQRSSIGRYRKKLVFIIGAQYPDESQAQLWLDKETFHPVRLLLYEKKGNANSDKLDFQYGNWEKIQNIWYPMQIYFKVNNTLKEWIQVEHIDPHPVLDETLFDIGALKAQYPTSHQTPFQDEEKTHEDIKDMLKSIEDFTKKYE